MILAGPVSCGGKYGPTASACAWVPGQQHPTAMCAASRLQNTFEATRVAAALGSPIRRGQGRVRAATLEMQQTAAPMHAEVDAQPLIELIDVASPYLRYSSMQVGPVRPLHPCYTIFLSAA